MFPQFHPPKDWSSFDKFQEEMYLARNAAFEDPIQFPHTLAILRQCSNPRVVLGRVQPDADLPPNPIIPPEYQTQFRPKAFDPPADLNDFKVTLTGKISCGMNQYSQVYRARIGRSDIAGQDTVACVKLYQQSYYVVPRWDLIPGIGWDSDWAPATDVAQREAWPYEQLIDLQGSVIPHSYGFYVFVLPWGEEVIGHVMEMLNGTDAREYYDRNEDNRLDQLRMAEAIAWSISAIHSRGVVHGDMCFENMCVYLSPPNISVVIFDFDHAEAPFLINHSVSAQYYVDPLRLRSLFSQFQDEEYAEGDDFDLWIGLKRASTRRPPWDQLLSTFGDLEDFED